MRIRNLLITFLSLSTVGLFAQDVHFSQLGMAPMQINPANTGFFDGYARGIINYRTQWTTANAPYTTMAAGFDANAGIKRTRGAFLGLGGYVYQDKAGVGNWSTTKVDLMSNVVLNATKNSKLALAIGAGVGSGSNKINSLTWGNQYNGTEFDKNIASNETFASKSFTFFDVCSGVNYEFAKKTTDFSRDNLFSMRLGVAAYHLNQPKVLFSGLSKEVIYRRYVANASAKVDIKGSAVSILPSVVFQLQHNFMQVNMGTFMRYRFKDETKTTGLKSETAILIGCYYRYNDAVIPQFMLEYKSIVFGFSFDETVSNWKRANRGLGAFEITLSWTNLRNGLFKQRREFGAAKGSTTPAKQGN
ncbi:MAG: PorP/SprF family type IX secretion system membrane protein [Bacteroidia bacterium]